MLLLVEQDGPKQKAPVSKPVRGLLIAKIRAEIAAAGAGTRVPEFKQSTKQRAIKLRTDLYPDEITRLEPNEPQDDSTRSPSHSTSRTFVATSPSSRRIEEARVLVIDNLLRDEGDLVRWRAQEWGPMLGARN